MNFYTADQHNWHKRIFELQKRPFTSLQEMTEVMIEKYNKKVSANDNAYFLGDFSFGTKEQTEYILRRLKGNKHFIWGNHDKVLRENKDLQKYFSWCKQYHTIYENDIPIVLCHFPFRSWDKQRYGSLHLFGHVHTNENSHHPIIEIPNSYNVGVDAWNFEPVSLQEILKK